MGKTRKKFGSRTLAVSISLVLVLSMLLATGVITAGAAVEEWKPNSQYANGDLVSYNGKVYECISPHISLDGWQPSNVPALWKVSNATVPPTSTPTPVKPTPTPTNPQGNTVSGYVAPDFFYPDSVASKVLAGFEVSVTYINFDQGTEFVESHAVTDANGYFKTTIENYPVAVSIKKANYLKRTYQTGMKSAGGTSTHWQFATKDSPIEMWAGDMVKNGVQDGAINMTDIMQMVGYFNSAKGDGKYHEDYDLNKDGAINMTDIVIIIPHFNKTSADYPNDIEIIVSKPTPTTTATPTPTPTSTSTSTPIDSDRVIVGYWETWDGSHVHPPVGHIPLNDTPMGFNVINVAFPILLSDGTCVLEDDSAPTEDVPEPSEIAACQASGRKVLLSIGGAAAGMDLTSRSVAQRFVDTAIEVLEYYGFDGIDIDIESGLVAGPSWNQLSPSQENLIYIINEITDHFGPDFMLTMAPETAYVTGGTISYGGPWGAYLPVIEATKDKLDWLQMQYYNGSMYDKNGTGYEAGTVQGIVKQTEALIDGFKIAGTNVTFKLPASKVVIGLPSTPGAGGGYAPPSTVQTALDALTAKYPNLRGLMTWSINWDASNDYEFVKNHRPYLDRLGDITRQ